MSGTLRLLLWLKWTLTWRGYRRNRAKVISTILLLVFFLPLSGFAAYGVWALCHIVPGHARSVARDALAIIYILWVATPLLGFQLNELYDLTKLFVYPISATRIFAGSLLGGLLDRAVLLVLPVLGMLLVIFSPTPGAFLLCLLLLVLFLLHTLALGQTLMLLLIGFLRSRRFRDATIVLFPLIGMSYYIGQRLLFHQIERGTLSVTTVLDAPGWRALGWFPPGWAAWGLDSAVRGQYGPGLLALLYLGLAGAFTVWVATTTLQTLYVGDAGPLPGTEGRSSGRKLEMPGRSAGPTEERTVGAALLPGVSPRPLPGNLSRLLPDDIAAIVQKEWTYFRREPQYKALAVNTVYTLVILGVGVVTPFLGRGGPWQGGGDGLLLSVTGVLLLSLLPLLFNIWAGEGAAITVLFSLPTPRRALLLGKNVAHGTLLLGVCALGLLAASVLSHQWAALPEAVAWVLLAAPVLLTAGNLVSIRFPHRMLVRGQRWQRGGVATAGDGSSGCAYAFLYLLAYGATFLALLPVLAAILLPNHWGISGLWYALSLPLAAVYSGTLYVILLRQAEVWLLAREPEIMQRIVPGE